jgi:hypothetical protein
MMVAATYRTVRPFRSAAALQPDAAPLRGATGFRLASQVPVGAEALGGGKIGPLLLRERARDWLTGVALTRGPGISV